MQKGTQVYLKLGGTSAQNCAVSQSEQRESDEPREIEREDLTMSHPSECPPQQLNDQIMGSWSNGLPTVAPIVAFAIEELGTTLVPQEVHPPQEALFSNKRIFIHAPQFHWHEYG